MDDNLMALIIEWAGNIPVVIVILYAWRLERGDKEYWRDRYVNIVERMFRERDGVA